MDYQQIKVKGGIKSFKVQENNEFVLTNDGVFLNEKRIYERVETFSLFKSRLIFVKGDTTFLLRKNGVEFMEETQINKVIIHQSASINDAVFTSEINLDDFTLRYEIVEFDTKNTVFKLGRLPFSEGIYRDGNAIFLYLENELTCFMLNSQKKNWELILETGAKIEKVIEVYKNQLLIACSDHLLLSVDVDSGKIIRKWHDLPGFEAGQFYKDVLPNPSSFVLDNKEGKLIGTFDVYYFEIDLDSGEIHYEDIREELRSHHINSFRRMADNPFTKDHLFVTAHAELAERPNVDLSCVLALNRNTKKVDWVHIFKDSGLGTNVPQITKTHLYQLTLNSRLYVFELVE